MSLTIFYGVLVGGVAWLLNFLNIPFVSGDVEEFVTIILQLMAILGTWYGRWRIAVSPVNLLGMRQ
jgi:hypothetical protein